MGLKKDSGSEAKTCPTEEYDFVAADSRDLNFLVDFCCKEFTKLEPHARAMRLQPEQCRSLYTQVVRKCLHSPYSLKVIEKKTGQVVGVRLFSVEHRDKAGEVVTLDPPASENLAKILALLEEAKDNFWKLVPHHVHTILHRDITFVKEGHQRKGIARYFAFYGLNFDNLKRDGIQGIGSEASSLANQTLLLSLGFKCLYKGQRKISMDDGTQEIQAMFLEI